MPVHLLDFNAGRPNRGTPAIVALGEAAGVAIEVHRIRDGDALPKDTDEPWILGGGPGSPLQQGAWRAQTLFALSERVASGRRTLAICYGFQLVAQAMGANVRLLGQARDGVYPLSLTWAGESDPLLCESRHGSAFEHRKWGVFGGAGTVLARGEEGDVAAVRYGPRCVGVIFHPEADFGEATSSVFTRVIPRFLSG